MSLLAACLLMQAGSPASAAQPVQERAENSYLDRSICIECHEAAYRGILATRHWESADAATPAAARGCERCHGPGEAHVMEGGGRDVGGLIVFGDSGKTETAVQNQLCLGCHQDGARLHWQGSVHESEDMSCSGCHRIHGPDGVLSRSDEPAVCISCHPKVRAQIYRAYAHPVKDEKMDCGACHAAHGSAGPALLKTLGTNELCYDCHAEKRGPFLWEHSPVSENCLLCHAAHGSSHPNLLQQRQPHLCQRCHQPISELAARHARLALSYRAPGSPGTGPDGGAPGISRFVLGESCLNCHSQVHGSNHPSGASLMR